MIISGQAAEQGDGDPVQTRWQQIWLTSLAGDLGYQDSPVYYAWTPGDNGGYRWWQYFTTLGIGDFPPTGMIACGINNCACAIYGPLFNYYDGQQQFDGPLGFPTSDVTKLSDGSSYVVFDNGVLSLDTLGNVTEMQPLSPGLVQSLGGVDPSISGITQLGGQIIQQRANDAVQSNSQLSGEVSSIRTTTTFDHVEVGSCMNQYPAGFTQQQGRCRAHVFKVHFDFNLKGCAGVFGGASADTTVVVRLAVTTPGVQAFLVSYSIDSISSPVGAGQDQINSGLSQAFSSAYGQDLLGIAVPKGISIIATIVDDAGNANIYIQSVCTGSIAMSQVEPSLKVDALTRLRRLRDYFLAHRTYGGELTRLIETVGPIFLARISAEKDALQLLPAVAAMISGVDPEDASVQHALDEIAPRMVHLQQIAPQSDRNVLENVLVDAIGFVRTHAATLLTFTSALRLYRPVLESEIEAATEQRRGGSKPS